MPHSSNRFLRGERIVNLLAVILSLLVSFGSRIPRVIAADGPRNAGFVRPGEMRAKQEAQRSELIARKVAAESEALYQFMLAEDRPGANEVGSTATTTAPRPTGAIRGEAR
jgi:hypothetical protein